MEFMSWLIFGVVVTGLLVFDLVFVNKKPHAIETKEALVQSAFWVLMAVLFGVFVFATHGSVAGYEYLTAYIVEKSLSVDNLFVFLLIFQYFKTPAEYHHRVLYWGILSAILLRAFFLGTGVALINIFWPSLLIMGAVLVFMGVRMLMHAGQDDDEEDITENAVVTWVRKVFPTTEEYNGTNFTKVINGVKHLTPLALALVMIETSDILFAFDSIPAVLSISQNMFVVYASNIFAIMGLRSLYFALASVVDKFCYLQYGISIVLVFIGLKLLTGHFLHIETWVSLLITCSLLGGSVIASIVKPPVKEAVSKD